MMLQTLQKQPLDARPVKASKHAALKDALTGENVASGSCCRFLQDMHQAAKFSEVQHATTWASLSTSAGRDIQGGAYLD